MRPVSIHTAWWRYPGAWPDANFNFRHIARFAQTLERGKFDAFFMADHLALLNMPMDALKRSATTTSFDPLTLLPALAVLTERLGLIATASTTFNDPYHIARKFASLDHISDGRAGWNLVTTSNPEAALNFGLEAHVEHGARYRRAREFYDVVTGLWDSWADDALVGDRTGGRFADTRKIRPIDHAGEFFSVKNSLTLPRPPQGWPVLVQAGGSQAGIDFAASVAEVIFTAQTKLAEASAFRQSVESRMPKYGRDPARLRVLPGLMPIIGDTEQSALRKEEELNELLHPAVGIWMLSEQLKFRLYDLPADARLPNADIRASSSDFTPRATSLLDKADAENLTIRECGRLVAASRSHGSIVGTPEQIVDHIVAWFEAGAADGFNIMPPYFPSELDVFVDEVIPILQRRGLFRTAYEGATLRDHLGLARPVRS
jgi:FMN-dependent oxidoreductase (nitrilotriacetate monooxygenase family)